MALDTAAPILVVDDQLVMGGLVKRILSRLGFENVDHTRNSDHALSLVRQNPYRLVLSDLHMDVVSGLELLRIIRSDEALKGTRFILMTGSVEVATAVAAKQGGADGFLVKPFTGPQLKAKLDSVFAD